MFMSSDLILQCGATRSFQHDVEVNVFSFQISAYITKLKWESCNEVMLGAQKTINQTKSMSFSADRRSIWLDQANKIPPIPISCQTNIMLEGELA